MAKMWAGRFKKEADSKVNDFNSSISFDARMYQQDIMGSIAHAAMLGETGDHRPDGGGQDYRRGFQGILGGSGKRRAVH